MMCKFLALWEKSYEKMLTENKLSKIFNLVFEIIVFWFLNANILECQKFGKW